MASKSQSPAGTGLDYSSVLAELSYIHVKQVLQQETTSPTSAGTRSSHVDRITASVSYPIASYVNVSIPWSTSGAATLIALTPRISSLDFLPPLQCASSLQLNPMPDSLPTTCSQKIVSHSSLPHDTLNLLSHNTQTLMESSPAAKTRPTEKSTLMTISHPNNPYVPWTPEIRRNIIRPIAVPTLCKQFGLPNSDKAEFSWDKPARTRLKLPTTLKNLSNSINKNFKQVVRRISRQKNESKPDMLDTSHCYHHYMSTNSFESSDTSTLHTWLSNRQRTEKLPSKEMTLDEYEERGSWLDLPQPSLTDAVVHGAFPTIQRTKCTQSDPPLRTCSQHDSSPCHWASEGVLSLQLDEHDLPCTFARTRELSMPGGWTFG